MQDENKGNGQPNQPNTPAQPNRPDQKPENQ